MKSGKLAIWLAVIVLFGCQFWKDKTVPQELLGVWETSAERYKGCSFEFTEKMIIFVNDEKNHTDINHIKSIEKVPKNEKTLYHICYKNEEGLEYKISFFYFKRGNEGVIHYKNQKGVEWTRAGKESDSEG